MSEKQTNNMYGLIWFGQTAKDYAELQDSLEEYYTIYDVHGRLTENYMAPDCAVLQERRNEYYMTDSLETLHGPGGWSVTGKAGGILHDWLTEDRTCYPECAVLHEMQEVYWVATED